MFVMKSNLGQDKVKILVAYHKPAELLKSTVYVPVWAGKNIAMQNTKDGKLSRCDKQWMEKYLEGDDKGENISALNRYFNEMTVIYWGGKNQEKLGNPEYIGLMHYRRHFIFNLDVTFFENCARIWI